MHTSFLNKLNEYKMEVGSDIQQRLTDELLSGLASSLLNDSVFEICRTLREVQHLEEKNLFSSRVKMVNEQVVSKQEVISKHREKIQSCLSEPENLQAVQAQCEKEAKEFDLKCEDELKKKDMRIIMELDQKVMDQQVTLEKLGIPGFYVTNKEIEMQVQMCLLEFILKLQNSQEND
ncbi:unnamed protein product [Dimorphilus gyrociliatus]|uniref:Uncharacterized protein n=1 Tax=Dimorphilus gyrociliatus TaxID=2664684 RepID=A0A7I8V3U1_9ANNE|nr:unnamed protein product [Dimorphilus gyrociliatus]